MHPCVDLVEIAVDSDAVAAIGVFSRLHDPQSLLPLLFGPLVLLKISGELQPGLVSIPFDVEGDGEVVEHLEVVAFIVGLHVVVERLLVAQELVVLEVVVHAGLYHLLQQLGRFVPGLLAAGLAVSFVAEGGLRALLLQEVGLLLELRPAEVTRPLAFLLAEGPPPSFLQQLLYQVAVVAPAHREDQRVSAVALDLAEGDAVEGGRFSEALMVLRQFGLKGIVVFGAG